MGFQIQSTATSFFFLHIQSLISIQRAQGSALPEERDMTRGEQSHVQNTDKKLYYFQFISPISKKKNGELRGHSQVHSIYNFAYVHTNAIMIMGVWLYSIQYFGTHYFELCPFLFH